MTKKLRIRGRQGMEFIPTKPFTRMIALLGAVALFGGLIWLISDLRREQRNAEMTDTSVLEITSLLDLEPTLDFHRQVDKVRSFINDNSVHKVDREFRANQGNPAAFAAGVLAYARRLSPEPVHMECSTRTNLMARILNSLGYETRIVAVFDSDRNLRSHSFLEVINPQTGRWETQDPDYDIYWQNVASKERASIAEAAEFIEDIEPCGRESCGWQNVSREGIKANKLKGYLDIISITQKERGVRYTLYTSRADIKRIYRKGRKKGEFCQVEAKRCENGFYDIKNFRGRKIQP